MTIDHVDIDINIIDNILNFWVDRLIATPVNNHKFMKIAVKSIHKYSDKRKDILNTKYV